MSEISLNSSSETGGKEKFDRTGWLLLAGLTVLAIAMRFYRLDSVPAGLHYDEAFNGLDALFLLDLPFWEWPLFFTGNYGREPLFIWFSGIAHSLFGPSVWTARLISALSGTLLIPAVAWFGWQLSPSLGVRDRQLFSLWCAAAILGLLWSQVFARYGIRANLFVLVEAILWAAVWRAWQLRPPAICAWLSAGSLIGLSFYTYLPARLLPLVLLFLLVAAFFHDRKRLRLHFPGLLGGVLSAAIVAAPLGIYFLRNPVSFSTRIGQVVAVDGRNTALSNLVDVLGMFFLSGDQNPLNNLPARPALDPLMALLFLIGIGLALHRFRGLGRQFVIVGLGTLLLPTVLSDFAPNFQRAIGALPFTILLVAFGADGFVRFIELLFGGKMVQAGQIAVWAILAVSIVLTTGTYFGVWNSSPVMFYRWTEGYRHLARHIDSESEARVYISPRDPTHQHQAAAPHPALGYLLMGREVTPQYHDERSCIRVALTAPARYFSLAGVGSDHRLRFESYMPGSTPARPVIFDYAGQPWATEFEKEKGAPIGLPSLRPHKAELDDGISLNGYSISSEKFEANEPIHVRLYWLVNRPPTTDYTLFFHLVHDDGNGSLERLAVYDRPPGNGSCPTSEWLPGEMVIDEVRMVLPASVPPGDLYVSLGLYIPSNGTRLSVAGSADNQVLIGPLTRAR